MDLLDIANRLQTDLTKVTVPALAQAMLKRLTHKLCVTPEMQDYPAGRVFKNGYLEFDSKQFLPNTPDRFVREAPTMAFDQDAGVGPDTLKYLLALSGGSLKTLVYLRVLGRDGSVDREQHLVLDLWPSGVWEDCVYKPHFVYDGRVWNSARFKEYRW
jgi:phage/plasmid-associated DNA primase